MLDKTVDFYKKGEYVKASAFSTETPFEDVVGIYLKYNNYDKVVIRQWEDMKEVKIHTISFVK